MSLVISGPGQARLPFRKLSRPIPLAYVFPFFVVAPITLVRAS